MKSVITFGKLGICVSSLLMLSTASWAWDLDDVDEELVPVAKSTSPEFNLDEGCSTLQVGKIMKKAEQDWADGEDTVSQGLFSNIGQCSVYQYDTPEARTVGLAKVTKTKVAGASVTLGDSASYRLATAICEDAKKTAEDNPDFNHDISTQIDIVGQYLPKLVGWVCVQEMGSIALGKLTAIVFQGDILPVALTEMGQDIEVYDPKYHHMTYYQSRDPTLYIDPILLLGERGEISSARILGIDEIFHPESIVPSVVEDSEPSASPARPEPVGNYTGARRSRE